MIDTVRPSSQSCNDRAGPGKKPETRWGVSIEGGGDPSA